MLCAVIPGVKKIAILRSLVLGDLIFALSAIRALRQTYPQAEITWIGREWQRDFVLGRVEGIDRYEVIRPSQVDFEDLGFMIDPQQASLFFEKMRAEQFDLALQMQGGGKNSNPFVRRLHPRWAVGPCEASAQPLDRWIPYEYHQNEVIRMLDIAGLAGAATADLNPSLPVLPADRAAAEPFLRRIGGPFVVLHAGARDIRRCWPPQRYAELGDAIHRELGLQVVLTGMPKVADDSAGQIEAWMQERAVNLAGQLSLSALTGLLANAALMVSNDTGPLHLALAVGTKAVGLYWVEYIIKSLPLRRDIFEPLIDWNRTCPLCNTFMNHFEVVSCDPRPCMHEASFLEHISVEDALRAIRMMLERGIEVSDLA